MNTKNLLPFHVYAGNNSMSYCYDALPLQKYFFDHVHQHHEILIFLQGDAEMIVDGIVYPLEENDAIVIPKGKRHYLRLLSDVPYHRLCVDVQSNYLLEHGMQFLFKSCEEGNPLVINLNNGPFLHSFMQATKMAAQTNNPQIKEALFNERMMSFYYSCMPYEMQKKKDNSQLLIEKALQYIDENLDKTLSLESIANGLFVSPTYLCKLFHKKTGTPIMRHVNMRRILRAKQYISEGLPLKEVCFTCGYENYVTFFRVFRAETGISPSEYKKHF